MIFLWVQYTVYTYMFTRFKQWMNKTWRQFAVLSFNTMRILNTIVHFRINVFIIQSKSKNGLIKTSPPTWEWYLDKLLEYAMCRTELKELPSKALLCYIWARWCTRLPSKGEFSSPRDVVLAAVGRAQSDNLPRCSAINDICRSGKIYIPLIWKFIWPTYSL